MDEESDSLIVPDCVKLIPLCGLRKYISNQGANIEPDMVKRFEIACSDALKRGHERVGVLKLDELYAIQEIIRAIMEDRMTFRSEDIGWCNPRCKRRFEDTMRNYVDDRVAQVLVKNAAKVD